MLMAQKLLLAQPQTPEASGYNGLTLILSISEFVVPFYLDLQGLLESPYSFEEPVRDKEIEIGIGAIQKVWGGTIGLYASGISYISVSLNDVAKSLGITSHSSGDQAEIILGESGSEAPSDMTGCVIKVDSDIN